MEFSPELVIKQILLTTSMATMSHVLLCPVWLAHMSWLFNMVKSSVRPAEYGQLYLELPGQMMYRDNFRKTPQFFHPGRHNFQS